MRTIIKRKQIEAEEVLALIKRIRTLPEHPGDSNAGGRDARRSQPRNNAEWSN